MQGARYRLYLQGKELKDPQTGQSLGNTESVCCDVVINRVTPKLSYGVLENVTAKLDSVVPGALQVRELVPAAVAAAPLPESDSAPVVADGAAPSKDTTKAGKKRASDKPAKTGDAAEKDW